MLLSEMGACSWFHVPMHPWSRVPAFLAFKARGSSIFIQEHRNTERKKTIGMLISHSCEEMLIIFARLQIVIKEWVCVCLWEEISGTKDYISI